MGREEADRPSWKTNAQRNAWRNFKRLGFGWKIPLDDFAFDTGEGEELLIPYISPKSYLEYLMKNHPDCVIGGLQSTHDCGTHLQAFWDAYKQQHKSHEVYRSRDDGPVLSYTLPILVHGDEGRGKRRTGTMAIFLESPIGIPSESKTTKKRKHGDCDCAPTPEEMNRFKPAAGLIGCNRSLHTVAEKMKTNTKNHSFLQRWPLIVIPGVVYKAYPAIVPAFHKLLARQLKALFFEGFVGPHGRTYYAALIGIKADLKWHAKIGEWNRSFENQGRTKEKECCHICLGGQPNIAWEDVSESPIWEPTMFQVRPWATAPAIVEPPFDFGKPEAVFRTDPFHTGKLGIFRDVIASALFWFAEKITLDLETYLTNLWLHMGLSNFFVALKGLHRRCDLLQKLCSCTKAKGRFHLQMWKAPIRFCWCAGLLFSPKHLAMTLWILDTYRLCLWSTRLLPTGLLSMIACTNMVCFWIASVQRRST